MRKFINSEDRTSLIKFIVKYQYMNVRDAKYLFKSSRYYRNRIRDLIEKDISKKEKWCFGIRKNWY